MTASVTARCPAPTARADGLDAVREIPPVRHPVTSLALERIEQYVSAERAG